MPFSFGFSGDDIDPEDGDQDQNIGHEIDLADDVTPPAASVVAATSHEVVDMLSSLPSKIAYSFVTVTSPRGKTQRLPRRELFDIRMQLMAEDDGISANSLVGLDKSDIETNVYEGGYKSWECSLDLAGLLLDRGPRKDIDDLCRVNHVVELGCGTALPTLVLFHHALTQSLPIYFTLADYNTDVLRLVTLPNLILTWAMHLPEGEGSFTPSNPNPLHEVGPGHGELDLTPELLSAFQQHLSSQGLILTFISGSWLPSSAFLPLLPTAPELCTFVMGSETIYSPSALTAFTEVLAGILKEVRMGKAVVAAKRVYFGVGGSVDEFRRECSGRGMVASEIPNEDEINEGGVRRVVMEVQML